MTKLIRELFYIVCVILNGQNFLDSIEDYCITKVNYDKFHWGIKPHWMQKYLITLRNENPKWCYGEPYHKWGCRTSGGCPFCTDRSGAETLKLQRYRKHKEEWLIWLLFQSFARRQSEDASSLLVSIWARPRTLYLWCKVAQRCGSGVNSNVYIAVGKQSCDGKCTNGYIFWCGEQKQW